VLYDRPVVFRIRNEVDAMADDLDLTLEQPEPAASGSDGGTAVVLTTAELAECTCPEFCERDHDLD
jgi:hypothetical protein